MNKYVFILTNSEDVTSDYLEARLINEDIAVLRYNTDLDLEKTKFRYSNLEPTVSWSKNRLSPDRISSIIYRRPKPLEVKSVDGDPYQIIHLADEWREAWEGFLAHVPKHLWINHPSYNFLASHKLEQLTHANKAGLNVPASLATTSTSEALNFYSAHSEGVIVKPLASGYIERSSPAEDTLIYTCEIKENDIDNLNNIESSPVLFQEKINKKLDIRITYLDGQMVAVSLQSADDQLLDIRRNNMSRVHYKAIDVPEDVSKSITKLLNDYQLRFAAMDFAIQEDGTWVFFEINPNGQWAWLDLEAETNIYQLFTHAVTDIN